MRRERLRKHHQIERAAVIIQRKYMMRYARERVRRLKLTVKLKHDAEKREEERILGLQWYDARAPEYSGPHKYVWWGCSVCGTHSPRVASRPHRLTCRWPVE